MNAVIHTKCGAVVFYTEARIETGQVMEAGIATDVNGQTPEPHSMLWCPYCRNALHGFNSKELRQVDLNGSENG